MVRLSKNTFEKSFSNKKQKPFVVCKSVNTSHNIEIALQETKSLALLKNTPKKSLPVIKTAANEFENCNNSRKCSLTDVKNDLKLPSEEVENIYSIQEKRIMCPFLTPLKSKKSKEFSDKGMLNQQIHLNNDFELFNEISSSAEEGITHFETYLTDLEPIWAEFMSKSEDKSFLTTKLCPCILSKKNKSRTKHTGNDFEEDMSIGSSLVSVLKQDYWGMKEIHKKTFIEGKHAKNGNYENTQDLLQYFLSNSKSIQLKRCMYEIKQLHDSLKNKM